MKRSAATIVREYGPFPDVTNVAGVSYDGTNVWVATGDRLNAMDPASGKMVRALDVPAHAGTAFDGRHLYQISGDRIQKVDPDTGQRGRDHPDAGRRRLRHGLGRRHALGRAASQAQDPSGRSRDRQDPAHHRLEPLRHRRHLGGRRALARHLGRASKANSAASIRRAARFSNSSTCRPGSIVSGLESNGGDTFFCGGGNSGKVRAVRRPRQDISDKPRA